MKYALALRCSASSLVFNYLLFLIKYCFFTFLYSEVNLKVLFIGGTGTISSAITRKVAENGWDLWLLNRGNRSIDLPKGVKEINCDINNEAEAAARLKDHSFDVVAEIGRAHV